MVSDIQAGDGKNENRFYNVTWRAGSCLPFVTAVITDSCVHLLYKSSWKSINTQLSSSWAGGKSPKSGVHIPLLASRVIVFSPIGPFWLFTAGVQGGQTK
jgi:hypothetical protein